jgi:hypothetical protein
VPYGECRKVTVAFAGFCAGFYVSGSTYTGSKDVKVAGSTAAKS